MAAEGKSEKKKRSRKEFEEEKVEEEEEGKAEEGKPALCKKAKKTAAPQGRHRQKTK